MILYRGVNIELDKLNNGKLIPNGKRSSTQILHDGQFRYDGTATHGESESNAVRAHHIESGLYDGCYISTTTEYKTAEQFATNNYTTNGYIYYLDTTLFEKYGVIAYQFSNPKYPTEQEITIRSIECKEIPQEVIIKKEIILIE